MSSICLWLVRNCQQSTNIVGQLRSLHAMFGERRGLYTCDLESAEPLEKYGPGGYHPVTIGDTYDNGRYKVLHKLGYGGFSTVWLARDLKMSRNVALKVAVSYNTREKQDKSAMHSVLQADRQQSIGKQFIIKELDNFKHSGPNGIHWVTIMELLGPSVVQAARERFVDMRLPCDIACQVTRQAALAISYLHTLSIGHGDVHPGNLLFTAPELQTMSEQSLLKVFGQPELFRVRRSDSSLHEEGVPQHLIASGQMKTYPNFFKSCEIRLIDLDHSFFSSDPPTELNTPIHVRAPEVALGAGFDHRADLWSLGCTVFTLFAGDAAFEGFGDDRLIEDMIDKIGPLPVRWQKLYIPGHYVDSDSFELERDELDDYDFQQWFECLMLDKEKTIELSKDQVRDLGNLIRQVVQYEPSQRMSAAELAAATLWQTLSPKITWRKQMLRYLKGS